MKKVNAVSTIVVLILFNLICPQIARAQEVRENKSASFFVKKIATFLDMKSYLPSDVENLLGIKLIYLGSSISIAEDYSSRSYEAVPGSFGKESRFLSGNWSNPTYELSRGVTNRIEIKVMLNRGYECVSQTDVVSILGAHKATLATDGGGWTYQVSNSYGAGIDFFDFRQNCAGLILFTVPQPKGWVFPRDAEAENIENINLNSPLDIFLENLKTLGFNCPDYRGKFFTCKSDTIDRYGRHKSALVDNQEGIRGIHIMWSRN